MEFSFSVISLFNLFMWICIDHNVNQIPTPVLFYLNSIDCWNNSVFYNLTVFVPVCSVLLFASLGVPFLSVNQQHQQEDKAHIRHKMSHTFQNKENHFNDGYDLLKQSPSNKDRLR